MKSFGFLHTNFIIGAFASVAIPCPITPSLLSILKAAAAEPRVNGKVSDTAHAIQSRLAGKISYQFAADGSLPLVWRKIEKIFANGQHYTLVELALELVASGLLSPGILAGLNQYQISQLNSFGNMNPVLADQPIYPKKAAEDVPYRVAEDALRAAIVIPDDLAQRKSGIKPVLLIPGTAVPAGPTFQYKFGKLPKVIPKASMAWANIPSSSLGDVQVNSEYIAYAINHISALSKSNVTIIAHLAFKYWPSRREVVEDLVAISPDFHGTMEATLVYPFFSKIICAPAIWQQGWRADFVNTLRRVGGDWLVQPMSGKQASGILQGFPIADVSNNHVQTICRKRRGGGVYTQEGLLYSSLAWALVVDAFQHDGPGDPSRLNLTMGTEGMVLVALAEVLEYKPKISQEPNIMDYAL
ncbi:putative lipase [Aspergillus homomorphus CBS 101889]|uniref:Alpha/beta-hydrolase n=1 Tax=Aspergillus homomorphus (strain CBS 101889) TaxID=1450537 RepID=A0A395I9C2_ASPHC|nr:alpha/beta-hydrolase [Aspergillus homomorphus CBS 101889]RAL15658.1 alpha/beta-hydrolase [Aspergillus homomorphus CBS 101889]